MKNDRFFIWFDNQFIRKSQLNWRFFTACYWSTVQICMSDFTKVERFTSSQRANLLIVVMPLKWMNFAVKCPRFKCGWNRMLNPDLYDSLCRDDKETQKTRVLGERLWGCEMQPGFGWTTHFNIQTNLFSSILKPSAISTAVQWVNTGEGDWHFNSLNVSSACGK